jgi:hypothetical protein
VRRRVLIGIGTWPGMVRDVDDDCRPLIHSFDTATFPR